MRHPRNPDSPLSRRLSRRVGAAAVTLTVLGAGVGCGSDASTGASQSPDRADDRALGHVHGLGVDPGDGALYIASHFGVFRHDEDAGLTRVADRWQDTMAFTVIGPGHFLASGHPDLREDLPAQLGLIESTDAASTWRPVSLQGRADFHALEVAGETLYGYESLTGTLRVTEDREQWRVVDDTPVIDVAADPSDNSRLWATTAEGRLLEYRDIGSGREQVSPVEVQAPPLVLLDVGTSGVLGGLSADGTVYRSTDAARSWQQVGSLRGEPQAFEVTDQRWLAATTFGVLESRDEGRAWTTLDAGH
jgi:hypothetical protein